MAHINIENLKKSYGSKTVLEIDHLSINNNECLAIVGSNGSGKTTLLQILAGLQKPSSGKILVDQKSMTAKNASIFQKQIGYFSEVPYFDQNLTVMENFILYQKLIQLKKEVFHKLLEEWTTTLKVKDILNTLCKNLSKGQLYKLALLRAFIGSPSIILLDELSASIDNDTLLAIKKKLIQLKQNGSTIIIVSHQLPFLENLADRVIFLSNKIQSEMSGQDIFKENKRPLLEISCAPIEDAQIAQLKEIDPNLQINQRKDLLRMVIEKNQDGSHNSFIQQLFNIGLQIKQFYEVPISPEQLYKKIMSKASNE